MPAPAWRETFAGEFTCRGLSACEEISSLVARKKAFWTCRPFTTRVSAWDVPLLPMTRRRFCGYLEGCGLLESAGKQVVFHPGESKRTR